MRQDCEPILERIYPELLTNIRLMSADMALPPSLRPVSLLDVSQRTRPIWSLSRDHVVTWNGTHVAVANLVFRAIPATSLQNSVRSPG